MDAPPGEGDVMWWFLGGTAGVVALLSWIISRRGGSMERIDIDGHARAAAEQIGSKNSEGQGF
ncbi:hypothetical protein ACQBJO_13080 [Janibacter sp. G349]|uniref:hypothetical protein n=1 Tax=Janibacter sp. G349 TaxID=3405424 RepID=UPI003B7CAB2C